MNMDETMTTTTETTETTADYGEWNVDDIIAEVNGYGDDDGTPGADEETQTKDTETETGADAETPADDTDAADAGDKPEGEPEAEKPAPEPETFTLKHLDEVRTVNRDEVVSLAQKGMDYDRIRGKLDDASAELKDIKDWFQKYTNGQDFNAFRDNFEAAQMAKQLGIDKATALERIKLDRERKELEAERQRAADAENEAETRKKRAEEDVREFSEKFPEISAKLATDKSAIPQEVWDAVRRGERLVDAYDKYNTKQTIEALQKRNKELEEQAKVREQNEKNAARSTGSQKSVGETDYVDLIEAGWNSV